MGREIKRVSVDFEWSLNKVWQGFLSPDELDGLPCPHCNGGETWAARWLYVLCYRIGMLAGDVRDQERGRPMHPYLAQDQAPPTRWHPLAEGEQRPFINDRYDVMRPTADILDLFAGISGDDPAEIGGLFGRNVEYDLYKAVVAASGLDSWGACRECEGHGETERYPGQRTEREAWEPVEPPTGEGWQLWETTSEGSPISPVFATADGLIDWLTTVEGGAAASFGGRGGPMTVEQARGFVGAGWAPSMIGNAGGLHDGAAYVGTEAVLRGHEDGAS